MYRCVLLDDESAIVQSLAQAVDWAGYGFTVALVETSPQRALDYIRRNPVDLLITDVSMPGMTGIELMRTLRSEMHSLSTIVISAFDSFGYVQQALKLGAENYLLKPIDTEELADTLRQLADHLDKRGRDERPASLDVFRSNLTERWLKNGISQHELVEKSDFLGKISAASFHVVLLRASADTDIMRMHALVTECLADGLHGAPFFERTDLLVCTLRAEKTEAALRRLRDRARAGGLHFTIGLGKAAQFSDIHHSYISACALLPLFHTGIATIKADILSDGFARHQDLLALEAAVNEAFSQNHAFAQSDALSACAQAYAICIRDGLAEEACLACYPARDEPLLLYQWTLDVISMLKAAHQQERALHPCVARAMRIVGESHTADYSMEMLAERLGISSTYFGRIFKEQTGMCFNDYRQHERLQHARRLIVETKLKMNDIAAQCGFSSQTYFNRSFKRAFGVSPMQYRHA